MNAINEDRQKRMNDHNEKMNDSLRKLEYSQIVDSEYYSNLARLCDSIKTISSDGEYSISEMDENIEKNNVSDSMTHLLNDIQDRLNQIAAISSVISEKVSRIDFHSLDSLFFHYKEFQKEFRHQEIEKQNNQS